MKCAVWGIGSIGLRHVEVLKELGHEVAAISSHLKEFENLYSSIEDCLKDFSPEYIVIASKTSQHQDHLKKLSSLNFKGQVLVEKPLYSEYPNSSEDYQFNLSVGYNLRFHPLLQRLKKDLEGKKVSSVNAYCGQYLPSWRPNADYKESYSAKKELGGGVLRDLSHELDYLLWLFGEPQKINAVTGKFSSLEIETEDTVGVLMTQESSSLTILELNYTDTLTRRDITVNTDCGTFRADLIKGSYHSPNGAEDIKIERNQSYRDMHQSALKGEKFCTDYSQGLAVMRLIDSIEEL